MNEAAVARLTPLLATAATTVLQQFQYDHPSEIMYAFALVAPPEGWYIRCAIATEQSLDAVAKRYAESGYQSKSGDTIQLLRKQLRWANPDDGWYYYDFDENSPIEIELKNAFDVNEIEMYDGTTEAACVQALRRLDRDGVFGFERSRSQITLRRRSRRFSLIRRKGESSRNLFAGKN